MRPRLNNGVQVIMTAPFLLGLIMECNSMLAKPPVPDRLTAPEVLSAEWKYTERVVYQANHDPSMIALKDGRELMVHFRELSWEDIDKDWRPGRKLTLAYSERLGCVLIDDESRTQLSVISGWGRLHPLDILLNRNLELTRSTMDMVEAYGESIRHWEAEVDRLYVLFQESGKLTLAQKKSLGAERSAWNKYRSAHSSFTGGLIQRTSGTMWNIKSMEYALAVVKSQASHLQSLVEVIEVQESEK